MDRLGNEPARKIPNGVQAGFEQAEICRDGSRWLAGDIESLCISSGR